MRLDLYPLETETDDGLLVRFMEECGEGIQAASKLHRFKEKGDAHAPAGTNNVRDLLLELKDILLCADEITRRIDRNEFQKS
jgi:hypothetical protein